MLLLSHNTQGGGGMIANPIMNKAVQESENVKITTLSASDMGISISGVGSSKTVRLTVHSSITKIRAFAIQISNAFGDNILNLAYAEDNEYFGYFHGANFGQVIPEFVYGTDETIITLSVYYNGNLADDFPALGAHSFLVYE